MSAFFDLRTLVFSGGIISFLLAFVMLTISRSRKTYPGFRSWTVAAFLSFLGFIFLGLRDSVPDWLSILAANLLVTGSLLLVQSGLVRFVGRSPRRWQAAVLLGIVAASFVLFTYLVPSVSARIVVISTAFGLLYLRLAALVRKDVVRTLGMRSPLLWAAFVGLGIGHLFRAVYTGALEPEIENFMVSSAIQGISALVIFAGGITLVIGLIVLNAQRLEFELVAARDEIKTLRGIIPICSGCKSIRDDRGSWSRLEAYLRDHSEARFSHGICPDCAERLYSDTAE